VITSGSNPKLQLVRKLERRKYRDELGLFACEGEEMRPYPYGFSRDSSACNADQTDLINAAGRLKDLRAPGGSFARCVSPFGVFDLAGNLEEFVAIDSCTQHSFGTEPCAGCVMPADPHCDDDWTSGGCSPKVYCSHPEIGFRQSCENLDAYSSYLRVECVCDPDS